MMENKIPLVSVLMTSYNRELFIAEAIESVLSSTYQHFELIIVDDCSKDRTVEIARSFQAKDSRIKLYVNEHNLGDYPNRNKAASYASGKYLKYWDSDDVLYPHGLWVMVNCMEKYPQAGFGLIKQHLEIFDRPYPLLVDQPFRVFCRENLLLNNSPGSAIFTKDFFERLNGFSGKRYIGDYEFFLKCAMHSPLVLIPAYLGWTRTHAVQEKSFDPVKYEDLRQGLYFNALVHPDNGLTVEERKKFKAERRKSIVKNAFHDFRTFKWNKLFKKRILIKYLLR